MFHWPRGSKETGQRVIASSQSGSEENEFKASTKIFGTRVLMASYLCYLKPWFETVQRPLFPSDHPAFDHLLNARIRREAPGVSGRRWGRDSGPIVTEAQLGRGGWGTGRGGAFTAWEQNNISKKTFLISRLFVSTWRKPNWLRNIKKKKVKLTFTSASVEPVHIVVCSDCPVLALPWCCTDNHYCY